MTDPFEGDYSGEIVLTAKANFIEVGNAIALGGLPTDGRSTYLEFQYKSEMEMSIGILGISLTGEKFSNFFTLSGQQKIGICSISTSRINYQHQIFLLTRFYSDHFIPQMLQNRNLRFNWTMSK